MRLCAECGVSEAVTTCSICGCGLCDDCKITSKEGSSFCPSCAHEAEVEAIEIGVSKFEDEIEGIDENALMEARKEAFAFVDDDDSPSDNHID